LNADIVTLIGNLGFPIAVTVWLLYERKKVIDANTEALNQLKIVIVKLVEKLG